MICPNCKALAERMIYYGLPVKLCRECQTMFGFWSSFVTWLPFNGKVMVYEGSYWRALWHWLFVAER